MIVVVEEGIVIRTWVEPGFELVIIIIIILIVVIASFQGPEKGGLFKAVSEGARKRA